MYNTRVTLVCASRTGLYTIMLVTSVVYFCGKFTTKKSLLFHRRIDGLLLFLFSWHSRPLRELNSIFLQCLKGVHCYYCDDATFSGAVWVDIVLFCLVVVFENELRTTILRWKYHRFRYLLQNYKILFYFISVSFGLWPTLTEKHDFNC